MVLSNCTNLLELPSLYKSTFLTSLDLRRCSKIFRFPEVSSNVRQLLLDGTAIEQVPSSLEFLTQLVRLSMDNCESLKNLPTSICNLRSLGFLSLNDCPNITTFPEISANIKNLHLRGTAIEEIPSSIECLSNLYVLDLKRCRRLKSVSTSIHKLKSLKLFFLEGCSSLENFPEILETMEKLRTLDLRGMALKELPSSMENLLGLIELRLNNCENLICLPNNFYKLKSLTKLYLEGCCRLENFPEILETMEKLRTLDLSRTALKELPSSVENLIGPLCLRLNNCENLVCLPHNFYKLKSLTELYLGGCSRLEKFPEILETMERMRILDLSGTALKELPSSMENLIGLQCLRLDNCENLICLPDNLFSAIGGASLTGGSEIHKYRNGLSSLNILSLRECKRLKSLPMLPPSLEILDAPLCSSLEDVSSIKRHFEKLLGNDYQQAFHRGDYFAACISGSEIPEWFDFKSLGSSINIPLPWEWYNNSRKNFQGFVVSAIFSFQDYIDMNLQIRCDCHLESCNGDCLDLSFFGESKISVSDHLFLLYNEYNNEQFVEAWASNKCIYNKASFKFYAKVYEEYQIADSLKPSSSWMVKQCGVHPLFAKDEAEVPTPKRLKYDNR